jgi:hypothetical protein
VREALHGVAVQVAFENPKFETVFFASYVQGLKPGAFMLWVKWIRERVQPHHGDLAGVRAAHRGVAVQVAFETPNFETSFSRHRLKGCGN